MQTKHLTQILSLEMVQSIYRKIREKYQRIGNESLHLDIRVCLREILLIVPHAANWFNGGTNTNHISRLFQEKHGVW